MEVGPDERGKGPFNSTILGLLWKSGVITNMEPNRAREDRGLLFTMAVHLIEANTQMVTDPDGQGKRLGLTTSQPYSHSHTARMWL